jgi:hypothetical protein
MGVVRTRAEVARIITDFVDGTGGPWDWDDFSSLGINDPELEMIRDIVTDFPVRFPPELDGRYCNEQGFGASATNF